MINSIYVDKLRIENYAVPKSTYFIFQTFFSIVSDLREMLNTLSRYFSIPALERSEEKAKRLKNIGSC